LQARLAAARTDLARLAGLNDPNEVAEPQAEPLPQTQFDSRGLREFGLSRRPDLQAARVFAEQGEAGVDLARAQGRADITGSAGYSRVYSRFDGQFGTNRAGVPAPLRDRDDVLSAGVSVPLFGRNRNQGEVEAAVARARGSQQMREFLERSIPLEIEAALKRLAGVRLASETLTGTVLGQAEKNLEVIRRAYQLGQLRLLDVLNEERRLLETRLAAIDADLDVLRALAELERAVGGELQ
jgi:outer membrane protein, heavy metal efflux system